MPADWVRRFAEVLSAPHNPAQERAAERLLAEAQLQEPNVNRQQHAPLEPLLRQHSAASRQYNNRPGLRASERVVPRRVGGGYEAEAARHRPVGVGGREERRRESLLAGIVEGGTAEGRVAEWRRHVGSLV